MGFQKLGLRQCRVAWSLARVDQSILIDVSAIDESVDARLAFPAELLHLAAFDLATYNLQVASMQMSSKVVRGWS